MYLPLRDTYWPPLLLLRTAAKAASTTHHNVEGGLHKSLHGTAFEVLLRNKSLHSALCCKRELESTLRARSRLTTVPEGPFLSQILESSSSSTVLDVVDMAMDSSRREKAPAA